MHDLQWGQTNWNISVWRRERFVARPCKDIGGLCPKKPKLVKGFGKVLIKAKRDTVSVISLCPILWLLVRAQDGVRGVNIIIPYAPRGLELLAHDHQVVNIFHLLGRKVFFCFCRATQDGKRVNPKSYHHTHRNSHHVRWYKYYCSNHFTVYIYMYVCVCVCMSHFIMCTP